MRALQGLDQHDRGSLVSDTGITLDLNKGSLVNRAQGLIATPGTLLLRQLGVVDNSGGKSPATARSLLPPPR
ncbi:hypothetical protein [Pseudomonas aeruginosa]|uniref:hypothetical protein n=1 Tax=Pseudomonas aeruginosa TaxID=287 RepID=UPI00378F0B47